MDGNTLLPMSVEVHHALMDGFHVGRFINKLEDALIKPEASLNLRVKLVLLWSKHFIDTFTKQILKITSLLSNSPTTTRKSTLCLDYYDLNQRRPIMSKQLFCSPGAARGLFLSLVFLTLTICVQAQTQITTGTIQGTLLDANGAALPDANVEMKNDETNLRQEPRQPIEEGRFIALPDSSGPLHSHGY